MTRYDERGDDDILVNGASAVLSLCSLSVLCVCVCERERLRVCVCVCCLLSVEQSDNDLLKNGRKILKVAILLKLK
jgi:hypothetical protein